MIIVNDNMIPLLLTLFIAYLLYLMYTTNHDLDGY